MPPVGSVGAEETVAYVKHNGELSEASARATRHLPELKKAFRVGLPPGEFIELKAPFEVPEGGNEYMWVEVTEWDEDGTFSGTIQSESPICTLARLFPYGRAAFSTTSSNTQMEREKATRRVELFSRCKSRPNELHCTSRGKNDRIPRVAVFARLPGYGRWL